MWPTQISSQEQQLQDALAAMESKGLRFDRFADELVPVLITEMAPLSEIRIAPFQKLVLRLYQLCKRLERLQGLAEFRRQITRPTRKARTQWSNTRSHVRNALKHVRKAQSAAPAWQRQQLKRGYLDFRAAEKILTELDQRLRHLEVMHAAMIHPEARTQLEQRMAAAHDPKSMVTDYSISPKSSRALHRCILDAAGILGQFIQRHERWTGKKVPSNHVDRIITKLLEAAFRKPLVTEGNVKLIRIKARQTQ